MPKVFTPMDHFTKVLIYGASGVGKTTLASTAPSPLFLSAESGLLSIAHKSPEFDEIKSTDDLKRVYHALKTGHGDYRKYQTIVIDSISEINEIVKEEILGNANKGNNKDSLSQRDWGDVLRKIIKILREFRDLPYNVVFIAGESYEKDEDSLFKILPGLNGKAAKEIAHFLDIVAYLEIDKSGKRNVITKPNNRVLSKDRSNAIKEDTTADLSTWFNIISEKFGLEKKANNYSAFKAVFSSAQKKNVYGIDKLQEFIAKEFGKKDSKLLNEKELDKLISHIQNLELLTRNKGKININEVDSSIYENVNHVIKEYCEEFL